MHTQIIAKTGVFNNVGEVLLLRRSFSDEHRPGGYDLPGGTINAGEDYLSGAVREAYEETGLSLAVGGMRLMFATAKIKYHSTLKADVNSIWLGYIARLPDLAVVQLSGEHYSYEWHPIDEAISVSEGITQQGFFTHVRSNGLCKELWSVGV